MKVRNQFGGRLAALCAIGCCLCYLVHKAGETLGSTEEVIAPKRKIPQSDIIIEKDRLALTDATTNSKRFEPSVPTVAPTTVGKKGRKK